MHALAKNAYIEHAHCACPEKTCLSKLGPGDGHKRKGGMEGFSWRLLGLKGEPCVYLYTANVGAEPAIHLFFGGVVVRRRWSKQIKI